MAKIAASKKPIQAAPAADEDTKNWSDFSVFDSKLSRQGRELVACFTTFVKKGVDENTTAEVAINAWTKSRLILRKEALEGAIKDKEIHGIYWAPSTFPVDSWDTPNEAPAKKPSKDFLPHLRKAFHEVTGS